VFSGLILVAASRELKSFTSTSFLDDDDDDAVLDLKNLFSTFAVAEAAGCWRSRSASAVALLEDVVFTEDLVLAEDRFSFTGAMSKSSFLESEDFKVPRLGYLFLTGWTVNSTVGDVISCVFFFPTTAFVFLIFGGGEGVGGTMSLSLSLEYTIAF
jgi:hypothetical protein